MRFDAAQVLANARAAETDDLLDRVTAYRAGLEPEALDLLEMELHRRGVTAAQIGDHARQYASCLRAADGMVLMCSSCRKPAVTVAWGWHRIWGKVPIFPKRFRYCAEHQPPGDQSE